MSTREDNTQEPHVDPLVRKDGLNRARQTLTRALGKLGPRFAGVDQDYLLSNALKIVASPGWGGMRSKGRFVKSVPFMAAQLLRGAIEIAGLEPSDDDVKDGEPIVRAIFAARVRDLGIEMPPELSRDRDEALREFVETVGTLYGSVQLGFENGPVDKAMRRAREDPVGFDGSEKWPERTRLAASLLYYLADEDRRFFMAVRMLGKMLKPNGPPSSAHTIGSVTLGSLVRYGVIKVIREEDRKTHRARYFQFMAKPSGDRRDCDLSI